MRDSELIIGHVVAVSGAKLTGTLANFGRPAEDHDYGQDAQIGSLVKISTDRSLAFGLISSLRIPRPSSPPNPTDACMVDIDLFGEAMFDVDDGTLRFERGVSVYPGLGEPIRATTSQDLAQIYARPLAANVAIGTLHQDRTLPAYLATDHLLAKHFAVLGTTGCGKSCAVALMLRSILEEYGHGHVLLIDPHAEYAQAFGDMAHVLAPESVHLPYWLLNYEETVAVLCSSDASHDSEAAILKEAVLAAKREYLGDAADETVTVDTPIPYRLSTLIQFVKDAMGKLDRPESAIPYFRLLSTVESLRRDERYAFMFGGLSARDTMAEVLSELLRLPTNGRPITVFSLAGVPSEIVDVLVSLLCRIVFDFALWSDRERAAPMLLVCEEAHRYIPRDTTMGFEPTRIAISRIAKEGRKYGVSLGLVSQRPAELAENIVSQCNTLFAMRLSNEKDQEFVRGAIPESAAGLLSSLPALRTQEAVVVGEGASFPMRIRFADLPEAQRPLSASASFSAAWGGQEAVGDLLARTIARWRRHGR